MQAPERVTGVVEIDINPRSLALHRRKNSVDVEKWKAERLKTEEPQGIEVKRVRPTSPQQRQCPEKA